MKDILVGGIDNYSWDQIAPWVNSIRQSEFGGDIFLVAYRIEQSVIDRLEENGVQVYAVTHTPFLKPIDHTAAGPTQAHNIRFYHIWELLTRLKEAGEEYRYVITTDVRDVVFQSNPSEWLGVNVRIDEFIAPSEGLLFCNEEWNAQNMQSGYGPVVWDIMANTLACNVGTIAGGFERMRHLCFLIYNMTLGRSYPSDQSTFNLLVYGALSEYARVIPMRHGWAAQIGTSFDPTKSWLWPRLEEPQPIITDVGMVVTEHGTPHVIVHQWDRHPVLKRTMVEKYG